MNKSAALLLGAGIGAAFYFLDPAQGTRRRALMHNKATRARHQLREALQSASTDMRHRAEGLRASLRLRRETEAPSDTVLRERVRAAIGRTVSAPGAIEVEARGGTVTLTGPVLAKEIPLLIDSVFDVRGVHGVDNRLQAHQEPGNVPALQGAGQRVRYSWRRLLRRDWPPAVRLAAGAAGVAAGVYGVAGRGITAKAIGVAGLGLAARAATNLEIRQWIGLASRRHTINVRKTIRLQAPVERVFEIWTRPENFPHFMTHVREVRALSNGGESGRWHWKLRGSSGLEFEFDSNITAIEENRFMAWRSEPGAWVEHGGSVRFMANRDGSTTVEMNMGYRPPAGAVGHVVAKLLGDDPKRQLDDDLLRMKAFVETGVPPRDAAASPRPAL